MTNSTRQTLAEKIQRAYGETGPLGVVRRSTRVLLERLSHRIHRWSKDLLYLEMDRRLSPEARAHLARNARFRQLHAGRRAFVIGTGPSLAQQDIAPLAQEITLGLNSLWRHEQMARWNPTYYLCTDGTFFNGSKASCEFLANLAKHIPASEFFFPVEHLSEIERIHSLPPERTNYLALDGWLYDDLTEEIDLTQLQHFPNTVAQSAILCAMYMGCNPIYVMGLDHNWLQMPESDPHFHPGTALGIPFVPSREPAATNYGRFARQVSDIWDGYHVVKRLAAVRNVEIINVTRGGFLDLFPRLEYESLFEKGDR